MYLVTAAEAQIFEHTATEAEYDALAAAYAAAQHHEPHPDRFRALDLVLLAAHPTPVPVVATVGLDRRGEPDLDGAWVFLPGRQAVHVHRGEHFSRIRRALILDHYVELRAKGADRRVVA